MHVMHLLQRLDEGHLHLLKVPGRQSSSRNQRQTDQQGSFLQPSSTVVGHLLQFR